MIVIIGIAVGRVLHWIAGAIIVLIGGMAFFTPAEIWIFDKQRGYVIIELHGIGTRKRIWKLPLKDISAVELVEYERAHQDGEPPEYHSNLVLADGRRRALWECDETHSRDLANYLGVGVLERRAER